MRYIIGVIIAVVIFVPVQAEAVETGPCIPVHRIVPKEGHVIVERQVKKLISCAVNRWHIPGGVANANCIAYRESRFWPWADNGTHKGVFQQAAVYWKDRVHTYWEHKWLPSHWPGYFNPRANVIVSIRMMHSGGLSNWAGGC